MDFTSIPDNSKPSGILSNKQCNYNQRNLWSTLSNQPGGRSFPPSGGLFSPYTIHGIHEHTHQHQTSYPKPKSSNIPFGAFPLPTIHLQPQPDPVKKISKTDFLSLDFEMKKGQQQTTSRSNDDTVLLTNDMNSLGLVQQAEGAPSIIEGASTTNPNPTCLYPPKQFQTPHLMYHLYILRKQLAQWGRLFGSIKQPSRHDNTSLVSIPTDDRIVSEKLKSLTIQELADAYDYLQTEFIAVYLILVMSAPTPVDVVAPPHTEKPYDMTPLPLPWENTMTINDNNNTNDRTISDNEFVQLVPPTLSNPNDKISTFINHTISTGSISPLLCGGNVAPLSPLEITARFGHIVPYTLSQMLYRVLGCNGFVFEDEDGINGRYEPPDYLIRVSYYNPHGFSADQIGTINSSTNPWAARRNVVKFLKTRLGTKKETNDEGEEFKKLKVDLARWIHNRLPYQGPKGAKMSSTTTHNGPTKVLWDNTMTEAPPPDGNSTSSSPIYGGSLDASVFRCRGLKVKTGEYLTLEEYRNRIGKSYDEILKIDPFQQTFDLDALKQYLSSSPSLTLQSFLCPPSLFRSNVGRSDHYGHNNYASNSMGKLLSSDHKNIPPRSSMNSFFSQNNISQYHHPTRGDQANTIDDFASFEVDDIDNVNNNQAGIFPTSPILMRNNTTTTTTNNNNNNNKTNNDSYYTTFKSNALKPSFKSIQIFPNTPHYLTKPTIRGPASVLLESNQPGQNRYNQHLGDYKRQRDNSSMVNGFNNLNRPPNCQ